ncbi:MAG: divalent metal cation transporter [Planctomycetota bacterium]
MSHLVQSTRAGAVYGLTLLGLIIVAHVMKLPAMLFGPRYASATGRSLIHAYREQGWHAIAAFAVIQVGTMFTIQAAVTIVTAALVKGVIVDPIAAQLGVGSSIGVPWISVGVLALCAVPLALGGYSLLDRVVKVLMVVMAVSTVAAAATQLPTLLSAGLPIVPEFRAIDAAWIAFAVALVGWMPAPLDISVWHSLWAVAKSGKNGRSATRRECDTDFLVGYALCVVLAASFVVLGAALLHSPGIEPAAGGAAFASQLISLYTDALGAWAQPVISVCAVAVMFSTTLTVLDAIPRTLAEVWSVSRPRAVPSGARPPATDAARTPAYWITLLVLSGGALLIIAAFSARMRTLVDIATTLSFIGTPVIAWLNHRAMLSASVPAGRRPGPVLRVWSLLGIAMWLAFAGVFLVFALPFA